VPEFLFLSTFLIFFMKKMHLRFHASIACLSLFVLLSACQKKIDQQPAQQEEIASSKHPQELKDFQQVNLVGNNMDYNPARVDPNLVNAWGIAFTGNGIAWVNAQATGLSEIFDKEGLQLRPPVSIPSPTMPTGGHPTGIVFNSGANFVLSNGQPARFIFVGDDGVLSAWNNAAGNFAIRIKDNSATASYTGLTLAMNGMSPFLYAANFKAGTIDVFDKNFMMVPMPMGFHDAHLPRDYSPFNIQVVDGKLYVMYAKVDEEGEEVKHPGFGFVDIFNTDGSLFKRFIEKGQLNAPWGVAHAPAGFFVDPDDDHHGMKEKDEDETDAILVGNFGDGRINAYSKSGKFLGQLRQHGQPVVIEGLWAIMFPPTTATTVDPNRLYFAAGPEDEADGLFGYIKKN
jgi:uncharacterized protein (TIGR03118 family)